MLSIDMKVHHLTQETSHKPHTYVKFPHLFVPCGIFKAASKFFWNEVWNREKRDDMFFNLQVQGRWFTSQKSGIFRVEVSSQGLIHGKYLRNGIHKKLRKKACETQTFISSDQF